PLKAAEEVISGLGVILIGWGVALEERHKLREIFGLIGEREAREEAIDESMSPLRARPASVWALRGNYGGAGAYPGRYYQHERHRKICAGCGSGVARYRRLVAATANSRVGARLNCAAIADPRNKSIAAPGAQSFQIESIGAPTFWWRMIPRVEPGGMLFGKP